MTHAPDLYGALKERAYGAAKITAGCGDSEAQTNGYADVFDMIMSNSDHSRQAAFVGLLPSILSEEQRQVLLDGMAREYAKLESWMTYVNREMSERTRSKERRPWTSHGLPGWQPPRSVAPSLPP